MSRHAASFPQAGTFVLARRWDQLGGRLGAIANARSLAELLELPFRFIWPLEREITAHDLRELFSDEFLTSHELASFEDVRVASYRPILALPSAERVSAAASLGAVEVDEVFEIVQGPEESRAEAAARFRRAFLTIGWSETASRLLEFSARWPAAGNAAGLHVRAGDIVTGNWRHFIGHEKYVPTPLVHHAIEHLVASGVEHVLVASDHGPYLNWLVRSYPHVTTTAEVVPGYERLTELQRAFADIVLLSRCDPIVGPPSSAFSRLAANLGGGALRRPDRLARDADLLSILMADFHGEESFWPPLQARDACWTLDVFDHALPVRERTRLARRALALDSELPAAQARLACMLALALEWEPALRAADAARSMVTGIEGYDDPFVEAMATWLGVRCLAAAGGRPLVDGAPLGGHVQELRQRTPIWLDLDSILDSLESLLEAALAVGASEASVRRRVARALARNPADRLGLDFVRRSGLTEHRESSRFDPVGRCLEVMALMAFDAAAQGGLELAAPRLARPPALR